MAAEPIRIDWSSAEVDGGRLTVGLSGEASKAWREQLASVVRQLEHGDRWGAIEARKARLRVEGVTAGTEDELRFFLESAVLQANADLEPEDEEDGGEEAEDEDGDERSEPDSAMTDAFRAFGDANDDD